MVFGRDITRDFARIKVRDTEIASSLVGSFNGQNILAALCMVITSVVHWKLWLRLLPHTCQTTTEASGWNTMEIIILVMPIMRIPAACRQPLRILPPCRVQPKVLIIGDMMELGEEAAAEHAAILQQALRSDFQRIITVGTFFGAARGASPDHFDTTEALLEYMQEHPIQQRYILLKGSRRWDWERLLG